MTVRDDELSRGDSQTKARIDAEIRRLPRDVAMEADLWPHIAARIDSPSDKAIRQLPRDVETGGDLWPGIRARIEGLALGQRTVRPFRRPRIGTAVAAGVMAVLTLTAVISTQFRLLTGNTDLSGSGVGQVSFSEASRLPSPVSEVFDRIENSLPGTQAAAVAETALELRRDLVMTRFERLRIEHALARSSNDRNLRTQWRHIYVTELGLIDTAQKLGNFQLMRSEI